MKNLPYNPSKEDFKKGELSENFLYNLYHDSDPTYTPIEYARLLIIADRMVRNTPIPVEEKPWERKDFCDKDGRCWVWRNDRTDGEIEDWVFLIVNQNMIDMHNTIPGSKLKYTHCLPHDAIQKPIIKYVDMSLTFFNSSGVYRDSLKISVPEDWTTSIVVNEVKKFRHKLIYPRMPDMDYYILVHTDKHPNGFIIPSHELRKQS